MKNLFLCFLCTVIVSRVSAQLKTTPLCPELVVHVMEGNVNDIQPNSTAGQIEKAFPCYTSLEPETDSSRCGGIISYKDKDIYFYTSRDYIEIGEKFKGKLSIPLIGAARNNLFQWLGYPKIKDVSWDAFQTAYGLLLLYYNKSNKVYLIRMSTKSAASLKLCE